VVRVDSQNGFSRPSNPEIGARTVAFRFQTLVIVLAVTAVSAAQDPRSIDAFRSAPANAKQATLSAVVTGRTSVDVPTFEEYLRVALADPDWRLKDASLGMVGMLMMYARSPVAPQLTGPAPPGAIGGAQQGAGATPGISRLIRDPALVPSLARLEPQVRKLLDDSHPDVRRDALGALSILLKESSAGLRELLPVTTRRARTDPAPQVRVGALQLLGEASTFAYVSDPRPDVSRVLLDALDDQVPSVRAMALNALGRQQTGSAIPRVLEILKNDPDWYPRWNAAHALTMMWPYSRQALSAVEALASLETDGRVREEIGHTLQNLRRQFPGEYAFAADAAFPNLRRNDRKLSERPLSVTVFSQPVSSGRPPPDDELARRNTCAADVVVRGSVIPGGIFLNSNETFIFTYLKIRVDEILRGRNIRVGQELVYIRPGGSMRLGGTDVKTEDTSFTPLGAIYWRPQVAFLKHVPGFDAFMRSPNEFVILETGLARSTDPYSFGGLQKVIDADRFLGWVRTARCR